MQLSDYTFGHWSTMQNSNCITQQKRHEYYDSWYIDDVCFSIKVSIFIALACSGLANKQFVWMEKIFYSILHSSNEQFLRKIIFLVILKSLGLACKNIMKAIELIFYICFYNKCQTCCCITKSSVFTASIKITQVLLPCNLI